MACTVKHTQFQPANDEWKCPKCGAGNEKFVIDESASKDEDCVLLHEEDTCYCYECELAWSGKKIAAMLEKNAKEGEYVTCPHCKGFGRVKKAKL